MAHQGVHDHFYAVELDPRDYNRRIEHINITGPRVDQFDSAGRQLIHWRIHGSWYDTNGSITSGRSVIYDTVNWGENNIVIELISKNYAYSQHRAAGWGADTIASITVIEFANFIRNKGRNRYRYSNQGSGCLHWCTTVLQDLQDHGYVPQGSVNDFGVIVRGTRAVPEYWVTSATGTFY